MVDLACDRHPTEHDCFITLVAGHYHRAQNICYNMDGLLNKLEQPCLLVLQQHRCCVVQLGYLCLTMPGSVAFLSKENATKQC